MIAYIVIPDPHWPDDWRVEVIDDSQGRIEMILFLGSYAETRAREYADWKNAPPPPHAEEKD